MFASTSIEIDIIDRCVFLTCCVTFHRPELSLSGRSRPDRAPGPRFGNKIPPGAVSGQQADVLFQLKLVYFEQVEENLLLFCFVLKRATFVVSSKFSSLCPAARAVVLVSIPVAIGNHRRWCSWHYNTTLQRTTHLGDQKKKNTK